MVSLTLVGISFPLTASASTSTGSDLYCAGQKATIVGTAGNDLIYGTPGNDVIVGLGGDDTIYGGGGDDVICAGDGADTVFAGDGNDLVFGGAGSDTLYGGNGSDVLNGGAGNDKLYGGAGADVLNGNDGADTIYGGDGNDTINGGAGNDALYGGNNNDLINGGTEDDLLNGGPGDDTLNGGDGADTIIAGGGNDVVTGGNGDDTIKGDGGDDVIHGGPGADTIYGGPGNDILTGDDGNDHISGQAGADRIYGGSGQDTIRGGDGNDFINGGADADTLTGGNGQDTYDWFYPQSDSITDLEVQDTIDMNWLKPKTSTTSAVIPVPQYPESMLDAVRTTLRADISTNDEFLLVSGNVNGAINTDWVNAAAAALHREFPNNTVLLLTSGTDNISAAAGNVGPHVDKILYGYEPNLPNEPEFTWDSSGTLNLVQQTTTMLHNHGDAAGFYPTGRPILQKHQTSDGSWQSYGWDYGQYAQATDGTLVQTQTYCADGTDTFAEALDTVNQQLQPTGLEKSWYPQITIAPGLTNSVSESQAISCVDQVTKRQLPGLVVWWSPDDLATFDQILTYLGGT